MKMRKFLSILLVLALCASLLPMAVLAADGDGNPGDYVHPPACGHDDCPPGEPCTKPSAGTVAPILSPTQRLLLTHTPVANGTTAGGGQYIAYNRSEGGQLIDSWDASGNKSSLTTNAAGLPVLAGYVSPSLSVQYRYANGVFQNGTAWGLDSRYAMDMELVDGGVWKSVLRDMDGLESPYASVGMSFGYGTSDYGTIAETFGLKKTEVKNADGTITQIWTADDQEIFRRTLDKDGNLIDENNVNQKEETTVTENPDGSTTTTTTYPDGGTKAETKYKDGSSVTVSTYPDGTVVTETFEKGKTTIMTEYPEDSTEIIETLDDGTTIFTTINKNGQKTVTTEYPNGTTVTEYNGGTKRTSTPTEGGGYIDVIESPSGTVTTLERRPDGTETWATESPDGSKEVVEFDANGNKISETIISAEDAKKLTDAAKSEGADNVTIDVTSGEQAASGEQEPPAEGTVTNPDGSTTTTTIESDGTIVEETEYPDGFKRVAVREPGKNVIVTEYGLDGSIVEKIYDSNGDLISSAPITAGSGGLPTPSDGSVEQGASDGQGASGTVPPSTGTVNVPAEMVKTLAENGTSLTIADGGSSVSFSPEQLGKVTGSGTVSFTVDISVSGTVAATVTADGKAMDIGAVSSFHAKLGSAQNRLDQIVNIQALNSSRLDTDIAEEMTAFTKNNILIQAAQAMLAQANQLPQGVLQLLQ